ncbi:6-phospho-beta-glucosidase [Microlunatus panaciterrae]|uniref:6-phospho-beta-glucosidase n=1 Tax=Microlunatus panaciterrae TaxID=400768 RepID=A0ABS2RNN4_9ACTN|nr:6-phospho-beta-glucosidase [Microlunatus panaciterrae]
MKIAILGGGGFRVPIVYEALVRQLDRLAVDEVALFDTDQRRVAAIAAVLEQLNAPVRRPPRVRRCDRLVDALGGADFVFSAVRVGGLSGRTGDERRALAAGVLGQETIGAGGVTYGLRTVPVATRIAEACAAVAPDAWFVNFTNPAGMVTEAISRVLGDRVIGICDSPAGLCRRIAVALGVDERDAWFDYVGLNHLGWVRQVLVDGRDRLPGLLVDEPRLARIEEGRLFGADWLQTLGAIPNEYLYYFYCADVAVEAIRAEPETRGEYLLRQQSAFYDAVEADPAAALTLWRQARAERDSSYMKETRPADQERDADDIQLGGYERVALALMNGIAGNEQSTIILNVRNRHALSDLDDDAVVEVPCLVGANGAQPLSARRLDEHMSGLIRAVKSVERQTIEAALSGSRRAAVRALADHPLVASVGAARRILADYAWPEA